MAQSYTHEFWSTLKSLLVFHVVHYHGLLSNYLKSKSLVHRTEGQAPVKPGIKNRRSSTCSRAVKSVVVIVMVDQCGDWTRWIRNGIDQILMAATKSYSSVLGLENASYSTVHESVLSLLQSNPN